ncbi:hypothetical protein M422DRAFT_28266 [Sphaerobolus stellatus SS14]|uniref:Uncharacterized protein n=1 Tax=Sphaerobolus stellatus (strain SS14) TaxID=990650 RepID=A0A0C9USY2_SPHS4|nr:hypothetical protein M422DRAFT_33538 [Sphaerobolus stellatus SS14]KIJ48894.1 hypothetical protein M422DRAFT_28266 [Sphaerobolus stellatus SS14]
MAKATGARRPCRHVSLTKQVRAAYNFEKEHRATKRLPVVDTTADTPAIRAKSPMSG